MSSPVSRKRRGNILMPNAVFGPINTIAPVVVQTQASPVRPVEVPPVIPPDLTSYIITENDIFIVSELGENLVTEDA